MSRVDVCAGFAESIGDVDAELDAAHQEADLESLSVRRCSHENVEGMSYP